MWSVRIKEEVYVKYPGGALFVGPVWAGNSHFPDFTNPKARSWWASQFEALAKVGGGGRLERHERAGDPERGR